MSVGVNGVSSDRVATGVSAHETLQWAGRGEVVAHSTGENGGQGIAIGSDGAVKYEKMKFRTGPAKRSLN